MEKNTFYITTPIYYPSDKLHIGHTYCTVATDAIARYKRLQGYDVMFLTGTDEHGQKIETKAEEAGMTPQAFVDRIVEGERGVRDLWKLMNISNDRFIRTTDDYHCAAVQKIFKKMYDNGDIYKGAYKGKYCTPCESFWTESQLVDGKCPDCGREVHDAEEEAYFFRLSKYADKVRHLLEDTDFHACCREDRLDAARTDRMVQELETLAGTDCDLPLPRDARTGAVITVDSFVGRGAHWSYSTLSKAPCLPVAAILYWLADSLAGAERRTLQADPEAAQLAAQWQSGTVEMFFHPAVPAAAQLQTQPQTPPVSRPARPAPTCARTKSWQSILAVMASM